MKRFKAIAAMSSNRVIGQNQGIPWHLPDDFRWFKKMTSGHILVMGRKTFESIGKPLPQRQTIVLSRSGFKHPGVLTVPDVDALNLENDAREVFVCGGATVYQQLLPRCSDLYLTVLKREVEGDTFFPAFEEQFELAEEVMDHPEFKILHYLNRNT